MKYLLSLTYILVIMLSNYFASTILLDYNGIITVSIGTLTFGLVFLLRDLLHRSGRMFVYSTIVVSVIISTIFNILTNAPLQIVIASGIGLLIGELVDTEVFEKIKTKNWLVRALTSNSISVPVDSFVFNLIAFYGTQLQSQILGLTVADVIYKYIIAGVLSLGIYQIGIKSFKTFLKN